MYNWRDGRHLLIDVAVINPLCSTNIDFLISEGCGGAATAYGRNKVRMYHDFYVHVGLTVCLLQFLLQGHFAMCTLNIGYH